MEVKSIKESVGGEAIVILSIVITGYCLMHLAETLSERVIYNFRLAYPFKHYSFAKFFIANVKIAAIKIRQLNPIGPMDPYCHCANRFLAGMWKLGYLTMFLGYPVCLIMRLILAPFVAPIKKLFGKKSHDHVDRLTY